MTPEKHKYFNREISWLQFNQRVLAEARDASNPLLERLKFLAITASNLDEFFMVRVGGLHNARKAGQLKADISGLTPDQQLRQVEIKVEEMNREQYECYNKIIEPELTSAGIRFIKAEQLSATQESFLFSLFTEELFSCITPLRITNKARPPLIHSLSLYCAVRLHEKNSQVDHLAILPLRPSARRIIELPCQQGLDFILLEEVVKKFINNWFPGQKVLECVGFRITRNADLAVQEDEAPDLMSGMEDVLEERKISDCVRLEIEDTVSRRMTTMLQSLAQVDNSQTYLQSGPIDLKTFMKLADINGFDHLRFERWSPQPCATLNGKESLFKQIAAKDILLFHPYESFDPVIRFIEEAAADPEVIAIKQVLYRTGENSPIVNALKKAALKGKAVTVLIELKARFDEARNIEEATELELAGATVIYGVKGFKTHAKICLVVRKEPRGIMRYAHLGTGNYNETTARIYSDIGLMTCNDDLCSDAATFFNIIGAHTQPQPLRKAVMAPLHLRDRLLEMIDLEIQLTRKGNRGRICAKMNALVDQTLIDKLYQASNAGVVVDLNIRGICVLAPGIKGLSENISVTSIVGRYLEHARIFYFHHGGNEKVFIASADWMPRNLDKRFELMVPIEAPQLRKVMISILKTYLADNVKSWHLKSDGEYYRNNLKKGKSINAQERFYRDACASANQKNQLRRTRFEPHLPESF